MGFYVALASDVDAPTIASWMEDYAKEMRMTALYPGPEAALAGVKAAIENGITMVAVDRDNGDLIGFISGTAQPHPFNPDRQITTVAVWYVLPDCRKQGAGKELLNHVAAVSERAGCMWTSVTVPVGYEDSAGLHEMGFVADEVTYLKRHGRG